MPDEVQRRQRSLFGRGRSKSEPARAEDAPPGDPQNALQAMADAMAEAAAEVAAEPAA